MYLRLDFLNCTSANPDLAPSVGKSGSAVLKLEKVLDTDASPLMASAVPVSILPFFKEVCPASFGIGKTTTEAPEVVQQTQLKSTVSPVGPGLCKGVKYRTAGTA